MYRNDCSEPKETYVDKDMVFKLFKGVKERKDLSPEYNSNRLLKNFAELLIDLFSFILKKSLKLHKVPRLWIL